MRIQYIRKTSVGATILAALLASSLVVTGVSTPAGAATQPDPYQEAIAASAAPGSQWEPGPELYGQKVSHNVPITMADGVVLSANVAYPTSKKTGKIASGKFPVALTITPYGKDTGPVVGFGGLDPYFVKRGYINVAVDVRGTGMSGGDFDIFDPEQSDDGVRVVHWAAKLTHSNGKVGMYGASYLGMNQILIAGAIGRDSPLKAIFPIVSANDIYRDGAFMGGIPALTFQVIYISMVSGLRSLGPLTSILSAPTTTSLTTGLKAILSHATDSISSDLVYLNAALGGPNSYDTEFWASKNPGRVLSQVVENGIPAYLIDGHYDLFQRGAPLNYAALQNAWSGRSATAPMSPGQKTTGRYQLLVGPYTHLTGAGVNGPNWQALQLAWLDTWLKGKKTGMADTPTPLHYYDLGTSEYANETTYPFSGAVPTTFYFDGERSKSARLSLNDGTLTPTKPTTTTGADSLLWSPVAATACGRQHDQWTLGDLSLLTANIPAKVPCVDDDRLSQLGPTSLTYSTPAFAEPRTIAGPISASIYATATTKDSEWIVIVQDVAPDGSAKTLTQGALLGSMRELDESRSWHVDGKLVMPYHPFTKDSAKPVRPGEITRYDVEAFPTYSTIAAGHRIRVTLSSSDFPHLVPTTKQLAALAGGHYRVQRTADAPSSVTIPLK